MPDSKNEAKNMEDAPPVANVGDVVIKGSAVTTASPVRILPDAPQDVLPQIGDDGKVRVAQKISDDAEKAGFAPDAQPKAHPGIGPFEATGVTVVQDSTAGDLQLASNKDRQKVLDKTAASQAAMEQLTAQLSVKVENAAQGEDAASIAPKAKDDSPKVKDNG